MEFEPIKGALIPLRRSSALSPADRAFAQLEDAFNAVFGCEDVDPEPTDYEPERLADCGA